MPLDADELAREMVAAMGGVLEDYWNEARPYAEGEAQKLAQSLRAIGQMLEDGTIGVEKAKVQLDMQKNAARAVLVTIEGLSIVAAEQAINAGLGVIRDAVNAALPVDLL